MVAFNSRELLNVTMLSAMSMPSLAPSDITYGWDPVVEGWTVPKWLSWVALIVSGYLGYEGLRLAIKSRT
jgi:hypothetical protein